MIYLGIGLFILILITATYILIDMVIQRYKNTDNLPHVPPFYEDKKKYIRTQNGKIMKRN